MCISAVGLLETDEEIQDKISNKIYFTLMV